MREDDSNWFSRWEEELPSPEELMPLSQTLITPLHNNLWCHVPPQNIVEASSHTLRIEPLFHTAKWVFKLLRHRTYFKTTTSSSFHHHAVTSLRWNSFTSSLNRASIPHHEASIQISSPQLNKFNPPHLLHKPLQFGIGRIFYNKKAHDNSRPKGRTMLLLTFVNTHDLLLPWH